VGLYDVLGRRVRLLYEGIPADGGELVLTLQGKSLPDGLYFIRVTGAGTHAIRAVMLVR